jgi:Protein of unknown function (DUF2950)
MNRLLPKLILLTLCLCFIAGCSSEADDASPMAAAANETAAIARLRAIVTAEENYRGEFGKYGSLEALVEKNMLGDSSKGKLNGYKLEIEVTGRGFNATAVPVEYGVTGKRSFFVDQTGQIRGKDKRGEKAAQNDPAI